MLTHFVGKERGVDAAKDDEGASLSSESSQVISAERVGRVDADADHIAWSDGVRIERLERLVDDRWRAVAGGCCRRQHEQPPRCDDRGSERDVAGIDQMNTHAVPLSRRSPQGRRRIRTSRRSSGSIE
jgi:hypothetical protein